MNGSLTDEIKSRVNIVDVVGRYVKLKRAGSNFKGLCPFHNEKTPSFVVSEQKQIFTCFGCGATGNVIEFVKRIENMEFMDAVNKICTDYNIELNGRRFSAEKDKKIYYEINREAARFFYRNFMGSPNPGYDYMMGRGIDNITLKKFGIGYADGNWDSLYVYLKNLGFSEKDMMTVGIISQSKGKYFDKYRNRVMFPIINTAGKVIGFGGRVLGDGVPKYLNSNESLIFQKKNNLFGLNLAKQDINNNKYVILVEGYMDVISLYQAGIRNAVASLGTALTDSQAAMLKRYTENVVLCYDSDEAGRKAARRGIDILYNQGIRPKVLHVEGGKDPDEYIKSRGKAAFLKLVEEAADFGDYIISEAIRHNDISTTQGSLAFIKEVREFLKGLSPVEADIYIKKTASLTGISEGAIRMEVISGTYGRENKRSQAAPGYNRGNRNMQAAAANGNRERPPDSLQKYLIKLAAVNRDFIPQIRKHHEVFESSSCFRIWSVISSLYDGGIDYDINTISDALEDSDKFIFLDIIRNIRFEGTEESVFQDCISTVEKRRLKTREREIIQLLGLLNLERDREKFAALTAELSSIQRIFHGDEGTDK